MVEINIRLMKALPNALTLLRVVLTCFLSYYLLYYFDSTQITIVIFLLIFMTDFLDGKVARLYGSTSSFGAGFDVAADFLYMAASYIVLCYLHIIQLWFLFIILFKFIEFLGTSFFINKLSRGKSIFVFDFIGRLTAVLFYILPMLVYIFFHFSQPLYSFSTNIFTYIITLMVCVSSAYRLQNCTKLLITKEVQ